MQSLSSTRIPGVSKTAGGGLRPGLASWPLAAAGAYHRDGQHRDAVAAEDPDMRADGGDEPRVAEVVAARLLHRADSAVTAVAGHTSARRSRRRTSPARLTDP